MTCTLSHEELKPCRVSAEASVIAFPQLRKSAESMDASEIAPATNAALVHSSADCAMKDMLVGPRLPSVSGDRKRRNK